MALVTISEQELGSVGVELLDDQPELQPDAMKEKFEETAKQLLAPKFNELVEQLEAETAAESLGAAVPEGLSEKTAKTVQAVLAALMAYIQAHEARKDNPHTVTAAQAGAYTKEETDSAIDAKVEQIGAGDMAKATYDPNGKAQDIFAYADTKMKTSLYDPQGKEQDIFAHDAHLYKVVYYASGWSSSKPYVQNQGLVKMDGGPDVTASSIMCGPPMSRQTLNESTNRAFQKALAYINLGWIVLGNGTAEAHVFTKPTSDIEVYLWLRKG